MDYFGLIEGGGTKIVIGIGSADGSIVARHQVPTTDPATTLHACSDWLQSQGVALASIGIAFFGPLDVDPASRLWGHVTQTTKAGWSGVDVAGHFARTTGAPVAIETDVDGAAIGEFALGAGQGRGSLLYLTVGTGIGGGFVTRTGLLRGASHPEMGHISVPRHPLDSEFAGVCPFHGDCLEGLASGPAIMKRWGASLSDLPAEHHAHEVIARYLGQAVVTFQAILQPEVIVMGGGVMQAVGLIERVRQVAHDAGNGYFVGDPRQAIVAPALGSNAGLAGALVLARQALTRVKT